MIETVVFDFGGVVAAFLPEQRLAALAELTGLAEAGIEARVFGSGLEDRAEIGEYAPAELLDALKQTLEFSGSDEALVEAWSSAFELDERVVEAARALTCRKAILTNNGPMFDACLDGPLRQVTDAVDRCHLLVASRSAKIGGGGLRARGRASRVRAGSAAVAGRQRGERRSGAALRLGRGARHQP